MTIIKDVDELRETILEFQFDLKPCITSLSMFFGELNTQVSLGTADGTNGCCNVDTSRCKPALK